MRVAFPGRDVNATRHGALSAVLPFARTPFGRRTPSLFAKAGSTGYLRTPKQHRRIDLHCSRCVATATNCGRHQAIDGQRVMTVNMADRVGLYRMRGKKLWPDSVVSNCAFSGTDPPIDLNKTGRRLMFCAMRIYRRCLTAALALAAPMFCYAGTTTTTFPVSAVINSACSVTAAALSFGAYNPSSGSPLDGTSTISVYCTVGSAYTVALDIGTGGGAYTARTIANGANVLDYNLYTSTARTTVWGDGTGATSTVAGSGAGLLTASTQTVYGRVSALQDKPAGTYTSTITVTVTF
jgi:spore coat protein U-like protein